MKKKSSAPLRNIVYYFSVLAQSKLHIRFYLSAAVFAGLLIPLANIFLPKAVIMGINGGLSLPGALSAPIAQVFTVIATFFLMTTLAQAVKLYIDKKLNWYGPYLQFKLREGIQLRAMTMDFPMTEDKDSLDKYTSAEGAVARTERIFSAVCAVLSSCILLIVYSILVCRLHPALLILLALNAWVGYLLMVRAKLFEASLRETRAGIDRRKDYLFQTMFDYTFGKETRLFLLYELLTNKFIEQRNQKKTVKTKVENKTSFLSVIDSIMTFLREAAVYGLLIWFYIDGSLTIDNFVMYIGLAASFSVIARGLTNELSALVEIDAYLTDYRDFTLAVESDVPHLMPDTLPEYSIEFRNVTFAYPGQSNPVLRNVSFSMENGKHTSLVGLNGAGKTTVVKLICRLYEPSEGEILLNGINVNQYSKASYYKHIAPVFQDSKLYAFSVKENITLDEDGDIARVQEILQTIGIEDKINALPDGKNTQVLKNLYDTGVEFSGGEKQRLCIARAMYKGGGIFLLDEPTAALDALAEKKIYEGFGKLSHGRTTLFISHRLNSNRFCDNIIFLEDGRITAQGSHDALMDDCPAYRDIYNMQAQYYVDAEQEEGAVYGAV